MNGPKSRFNNIVNIFPFHPVLVPWHTESLQSPEDGPPSHSLPAWLPGSTSSEPSHPSQKLSQALIPRDMAGSFRLVPTDSPRTPPTWVPAFFTYHIGLYTVCVFVCPVVMDTSREQRLYFSWSLVPNKEFGTKFMLRINEVSSVSRTFIMLLEPLRWASNLNTHSTLDWLKPFPLKARKF